MLARVSSFVDELRRVGIPVSISEHLDAVRALTRVPLEDRAAFKAALAATLVKHADHLDAFDTVFEVWFSLALSIVVDGEPVGLTAAGDDLAERVAAALAAGDEAALSELARLGVARHANISADRRLGGGSYELYRTLRSLELDATLERLLGEGSAESSLDQRLRRDELEQRARRLRDQVEAEVRRRLVAERGAEAVSGALRRPLPVDVDFMHASRDELVALRRCLHPLTRALAARLARRRRSRHRGRLDIRSTVRHSLGTGGVPIEPQFRRSHPAKPEIWVVADISGSVAAFARFTLALVHAVSSQFSAVRSFAFIDGVDEVTRFFGAPDDFDAAVRRVNTEAEVVAGEGHSDYGAALAAFSARYGSDVGPRTTVLVLGDARSNYHDGQPWVLEELARSARHVYWLNPEPRAYWDTGDSIMGSYAPHCDGVFECRTLRQLGRFVEVLA